MPYSSGHDPYCYPGATVLKNLQGLRSQAALDRFEARMSALRAEEPLPSGRLTARHYRAIHRHLFQDVYPWAGKYRSVRISKGGSMFCYPENIPTQTTALFQQLAANRHLKGLALADFARGAASFLGTLNAIHCFRDGNGRAQLAFMALICDGAGHPIDFDRFDPALFLAAMIDSFNGDECALVAFFRDVCVEPAAPRRAR